MKLITERDPGKDKNDNIGSSKTDFPIDAYWMTL